MRKRDRDDDVVINTLLMKDVIQPLVVKWIDAHCRVSKSILDMVRSTLVFSVLTEISEKIDIDVRNWKEFKYIADPGRVVDTWLPLIAEKVYPTLTGLQKYTDIDPGHRWRKKRIISHNENNNDACWIDDDDNDEFHHCIVMSHQLAEYLRSAFNARHANKQWLLEALRRLSTKLQISELWDLVAQFSVEKEIPSLNLLQKNLQVGNNLQMILYGHKLLSKRFNSETTTVNYLRFCDWVCHSLRNGVDIEFHGAHIVVAECNMKEFKNNRRSPCLDAGGIFVSRLHNTYDEYQEYIYYQGYRLSEGANGGGREYHSYLPEGNSYLPKGYMITMVGYEPTGTACQIIGSNRTVLIKNLDIPILTPRQKDELEARQWLIDFCAQLLSTKYPNQMIWLTDWFALEALKFASTLFLI